MEKTVLIGWNREYSAKQSFGVNMIAATVLIASAFLNLMRDHVDQVSERFGVIMLIMAFSSIMHGVFAYTKISRFSARVAVNENHIYIKKRFFSSSVEIPWDQIKRIQMAPYQIVFSLNDEEYDFSYIATADTSVAIKSAIREMAISKNIEVAET